MTNKLQLARRARLLQQQEPIAPVTTPMVIPEEFLAYESKDEPSTIAGLHRGGGLLTDNPIPLWKRIEATRRLITSYEHIIEFTTKSLDPAAASYQHDITFYTNLLNAAMRRLTYLEALKSPDTFSSVSIEEEEEE